MGGLVRLELTPEVAQFLVQHCGDELAYKLSLLRSVAMVRDRRSTEVEARLLSDAMTSIEKGMYDEPDRLPVPESP